MTNEPAPSFRLEYNIGHEGQTLLETSTLSSRYTNVTRPTRVESSRNTPLYDSYNNQPLRDILQ
jgi:hypothetical protein